MAAHLQCSHVEDSSLPITQILQLLMLDASSTGREGVLGLVTFLARETHTTNETFKKLQLKCPRWLLTEAARSSTYAHSVSSFLRHTFQGAGRFFRLSLFIDHVLRAGGLAKLGQNLTPLLNDLRQKTFTEGDLLLGLQASPDCVCKCLETEDPTHARYGTGQLAPMQSLESEPHA